MFPLVYNSNEMKEIPLIILMFLATAGLFAQEPDKQMVRLARLVIDSTELDRYNEFLREEIEASVRLEPGVLTLYAVSEKDRPTHITILEIYASEEAYQKHITTPHFLKYKNGTKDMVKSLELIDARALIPEMKIK